MSDLDKLHAAMIKDGVDPFTCNPLPGKEKEKFYGQAKFIIDGITHEFEARFECRRDDAFETFGEKATENIPKPFEQVSEGAWSHIDVNIKITKV